MIIDVRSDTVSLPTHAMRHAAIEAEVGDSVFREDPSVRRLEEETAGLLGKEEAAFMPSGTMANLAALAVFSPRTSEVILPAKSHLFNLTNGSLGLLGIQPRVVEAVKGVVSVEQLESAFSEQSVQTASTSLIVYENSADLNRGWAVPLIASNELCEYAHRRGVPVYLDGARLFNAAAALRCEPAELARDTDAVMVSLSKGLSAPMGAVLAGNSSFVAAARGAQQRLGGGWRQAGMMAAAGLVALDEMRSRLDVDNSRAAELAGLLADIGYDCPPGDVHTNILQVRIRSGANISGLHSHLKQRGILTKAIAKDALRMVINRHIGALELTAIEKACEEYLKGVGGRCSVVRD